MNFQSQTLSLRSKRSESQSGAGCSLVAVSNLFKFRSFQGLQLLVSHGKQASRYSSDNPSTSSSIEYCLPYGTPGHITPSLLSPKHCPSATSGVNNRVFKRVLCVRRVQKVESPCIPSLSPGHVSVWVNISRTKDNRQAAAVQAVCAIYQTWSSLYKAIRQRKSRQRGLGNQVRHSCML